MNFSEKTAVVTGGRNPNTVGQDFHPYIVVAVF